MKSCLGRAAPFVIAFAVMAIVPSTALAWKTPKVVGTVVGDCTATFTVSLPSEQVGIGDWRIVSRTIDGVVHNELVATGPARDVTFTVTGVIGAVRTEVGAADDMRDGSARAEVFVDCPSPPPPVVTPPPAPTPPAVETTPPPVVDTPPVVCVERATGVRLVRHGHRYVLHGRYITHIRWFVDGHPVGSGRRHRVTRFRGHHVIAVRAHRDCGSIRLDKRIPLPPARPPRFAG